MNNCFDLYKGLYEESGRVLFASFEDKRKDIYSKSHSYIIDIEKWILVLSSRNESEVLKIALREYQFSLLALGFGQYRQAFSALRLFLELTMATVFFSMNEINFRRWKLGERDVIWANLIDKETGILSKNIIKLFFDEMAEETLHYRSIAEKTYRECSEYIHGNARANEILPEKLSFHEASFSAWHQKAENIYYVITFLLCARYLRELDSNAIDSIRLILQDSLGHIQAVRCFI